MFEYEVIEQPKDTKAYLVETGNEYSNVGGVVFLPVRLFNRLSKRTQMKYIPKKALVIDITFKHPRAVKLKKVYIKQEYVDLELNIYQSL